MKAMFYCFSCTFLKETFSSSWNPLWYMCLETWKTIQLKNPAIVSLSPNSVSVLVIVPSWCPSVGRYSEVIFLRFWDSMRSFHQRKEFSFDVYQRAGNLRLPKWSHTTWLFHPLWHLSTDVRACLEAVLNILWARLVHTRDLNAILISWSQQD